MPVDLTKGIKRKTPRRKRGRGTPLGNLEKALTKKPKIISDWPVNDIYAAFVDLDPEDLHENLINYQLTLNPLIQKKEICALVYITQKLPWPLVKRFFEFMKTNDYQKISPALKKFIAVKNVKLAIDRAEELIRKRKAEPVGIYVSRHLSDPSSRPKSTRANGTKQCLSTYRHALWASAVVGKPIVVKEIVMRKKPGKTGVTNERWLGPLIRNGWHRVIDSWYETVCRFGRPWREETVGYLLEDGKILEEDKRLYDASVKYFGAGETPGEKPEISSSRLNDLLTPTWVKTAQGVSPIRMVALDAPETRQWIVPKPIPGTRWYNLKRSWYVHVSENGRKWIPGGFWLQDGNRVNIPRNARNV